MSVAKLILVSLPILFIALVVSLYFFHETHDNGGHIDGDDHHGKEDNVRLENVEKMLLKILEEKESNSEERTF